MDDIIVKLSRFIAHLEWLFRWRSLSSCVFLCRQTFVRFFLFFFGKVTFAAPLIGRLRHPEPCATYVGMYQLYLLLFW